MKHMCGSICSRNVGGTQILYQIQMEDDQNGRRPKWKTTQIEDDPNGRQHKWKMIQMEDEQSKVKTMFKTKDATPSVALLSMFYSIYQTTKVNNFKPIRQEHIQCKIFVICLISDWQTCWLIGRLNADLL